MSKVAFLGWFAGAMSASVALGIFAAEFQRGGIAPIGFIAIGVGLLLGLVSIGMLIIVRGHCTNSVLLATFLCAGVVVLAEHGWLYHRYVTTWQQKSIEQPELAFFPPKSMPDYFWQEAADYQWLYWLVDAGLLAATATVMVANSGTAVPSTATGPTTDAKKE